MSVVHLNYIKNLLYNWVYNKWGKDEKYKNLKDIIYVIYSTNYNSKYKVTNSSNYAKIGNG